MDMKTYEETRLARDDTWAKYMKEGLSVALIVWNDKASARHNVHSCTRRCAQHCIKPNFYSMLGMPNHQHQHAILVTNQLQLT